MRQRLSPYPALGIKHEEKGTRKKMTIKPPETEKVTTKEVKCDGSEGALGHPRVFLNMGREGQVECPYCDKRFILKSGPADKA